MIDRCEFCNDEVILKRKDSGYIMKMNKDDSRHSETCVRLAEFKKKNRYMTCNTCFERTLDDKGKSYCMEHNVIIKPGDKRCELHNIQGGLGV